MNGSHYLFLLSLSSTCSILATCNLLFAKTTRDSHSPEKIVFLSSKSKPKPNSLNPISETINFKNSTQNSSSTGINNNRDNSNKDSLDEIVNKTLYSKYKGKVLSRNRRTLILLHEKNPEKAGKLDDNCSYETWNKTVYQVYLLAQKEGFYNDVEGLITANKTMQEFQKRFNDSLKPKEKLYVTWGAQYCIGRYPMKCDTPSQKCKCMDLLPMYNFTRDVKSEPFCNARHGGYCNEEVDIYCEKSMRCQNNTCTKGRIFYDHGVIGPQMSYLLWVLILAHVFLLIIK